MQLKVQPNRYLSDIYSSSEESLGKIEIGNATASSRYDKKIRTRGDNRSLHVTICCPDVRAARGKQMEEESLASQAEQSSALLDAVHSDALLFD